MELFKKNGLSATENEYDEFNKSYNSRNIYFFVNKTDKIDEDSKKFLEKIQENHTYSTFNSVESLKNEVKKKVYMNLQGDWKYGCCEYKSVKKKVYMNLQKIII